MQNQFNNVPQPPVPPRANNYPNPMVQNQWNNPVRPPPVNTNVNPMSPPMVNNVGSPAIVNQRSPQPNSPSVNGNVRSPSVNGVRPPPPVGNGQMNNNRSPMNGNVRPPPSAPQQYSGLPNGGAPPPPPQRQATSQFQPPVRNNTSISHNSNIQVNTPQNLQRRAQSQKDLPEIPIKKSGSSVARSASSVKTKFVGLLNRSISRKFSTNRREKKKRLSSYGGMNVHSAYRNSLMEKPVFDSKLLLKPQNPNFIISLGIVFMIASVSLAIALVAFRNGGLTEKDIHDISNEDSYGFIFFSMFMVIIGLTGYVAYHKKWTSLLITYSVFLIFGFIVQIIIICLFLKIYLNPLIQMRYKWIDVLTDGEKQQIQEDYYCCGYLSVVDHGLRSSMCMPDNGATTLTIKTSKAMVNTFNYLDPSVLNRLNKRQDAGNAGAGNAGAGNAGAGDEASAAAAELKDLYKTREADSYTEEDIKDEGCARIIVSAIKSGLLQYILMEGLMAILFIVAFYFALTHFKEQLAIEKEVDSARATFG